VGLSPVGHIQREIRLVFEDPETFRTEYARNLSKGGAFVHTAEEFELLEPVVVHLDALFAGERVSLAAEVVHSQPRSGVSVQLLDPLAALRARLDPLLAKAEALCAGSEPEVDVPGDGELGALAPLPELGFEELEVQEPPETDDLLEADDDKTLEALPDDPNERTHQERAQRWRARIPVRVEGPGGLSLHTRSRDLSTSGILLSASGARLPADVELRLSIVHPTSGESLAVAGRVVRHVEEHGVVAAIAVRFDAGAQQESLERFVEEARCVHQERQQAGLSQALDAGGIAPSLRLLAAAVPRGTITVIEGMQEGTIVFEARQILCVELGLLRGRDALARLLGFRLGSFEFHGQVDPTGFPDAPLPMEAALEDAARTLAAAPPSR
jgi:Tfp pilus assembly protein PilZ